MYDDFDDIPIRLLRDKIRTHVDPSAVFTAARDGLLGGVRVAPSPSNRNLYDIYLDTAIDTILGRSPASEELAFEAVLPGSFLDLLCDIFTYDHCAAIFCCAGLPPEDIF